MSKENKLKIENICNKYSNVKCSFIEIPKDEVLYSKKSSLDFSTFSRLFLGSLIKDEIEKVLYLDADTLVLGSLKELYDLNME
ncbi:MAG: glycosyltransferase family 8 protein, partial [Methanobrevibacter sp.]|nr:glycosyltransferase family 8 protein [Candidatus Methanovirga basalitermitum]